MMNGHSRGLLALLVALLLTVAMSVPIGCGLAGERPAYKLGSGDRLKVTVYGEDDLSGEFEVNDQGAVALHLVGPVIVAGKTLTEVEGLIAEKFAASFLVNPRVTVEVLNYRPFFILGEVKNPASYPWISGMTVINAVALAGGFTPRAAKGSIMLRRAGDPASKEQHVDDDMPVLPGDVITVPERFF